MFLAFWLWSKGQKAAGWILFAVALVSIAFHLDPENKNAKTVDIIVANAAILLTILIYLPRWRSKGSKLDFNIILALLFAIISIVLFFTSGDDHDSNQYVVVHSLWHLLTAVSAFLFIKESM